jgi:signal transduction histidine kinase
MDTTILDSVVMNEAFLSNRLFEGLPSEAFRSVEIREKEYRPGEVIFEEGAKGSTLMLVGRGLVQVSKAGRQGLQETLATFGPNDFFGELSVIDRGPRSARAIALEPTLLGEVDHRTFSILMESAPGTLPLTFTRIIVQRMRYTNSRYIEEMLRNERLTVLGTMVSSIIHDLRNPMSAILSSVEYLDKTAPTDSVRQLSDIIRVSALKMVEMTDDLLGFAQGKVNLKPRATSVGRLLELLDEEILNEIRLSSIRVSLSAERIGNLTLDESRLTRCFANIIKNAKEALGQEGTISIQIRDLGSLMKVSISDTGPGIPEVIRGRIFEPFVTYGKKRGTGLGMAIAKSTIDAHGGRIWLESETGRGTTFHVEVPKHFDPCSSLGRQ